MADTKTNEQEPSIEEILDSIRQIISDEDEPAPTRESDLTLKGEEKARPGDVIDLTEKIDDDPLPAFDMDKPEPPAARAVEVELREPEPPPPPKAPAPVESMDTAPDIESLLTQRARDAAENGFREIAQRAAIDKSGKVTIEEVVREELRPMLQEWLDKHMPPMIERLVQKELTRIAERVMGD
ncbi:MAG: DUF2497 domain-containing protein [Alphaproteobacteria bacterium]|nr:DUF2497 domain-containing protein [Alphaproteobacteria bacterium]